MLPPSGGFLLGFISYLSLEDLGLTCLSSVFPAVPGVG